MIEYEHISSADFGTNSKSDGRIVLKYLSLMNSAKKRNKEFKLSFCDVKKLVKQKNCAYTDVRLTKENRSIDRVCAEKGYVKGNVVACEKAFNFRKSNLTMGDMELIHSYMEKTNDS